VEPLGLSTRLDEMMYCVRQSVFGQATGMVDLVNDSEIICHDQQHSISRLQMRDLNSRESRPLNAPTVQDLDNKIEAYRKNSNGVRYPQRKPRLDCHFTLQFLTGVTSF
jgi:hypothetical protein